MVKSRIVLGLAFGLAFGSASATNFESFGINVESEPPILKSILLDEKKRYKLLHVEALGNGMFGYVFESLAGKNTVIYKTPNNRIVFGDVFDLDGVKVSDRILEKKGFKKSAAESFGSLSDNYYFSMGSKGEDGTEAYVFFDPNCGYCKKLYERLNELELSREVRWLPVAYLHKSSAEKVQGGIDSGNLDDVMLGTGSGSKIVSEEVQRILLKNEALMKELGIQAAPSIVYLDGSEIKKHVGLPSDAEIKRIFGK